jgi:glycosyltransferase involved in cell wall biosynthesis
VRGAARALAALGHAVTVVCYGHGERDADNAYRVERIPAVPGYRRLRSGPDLVKPLLDIALAARIADVASDVVFAHNAEALIAAIAARARTGVPVVYACHTLLGEELPSYVSRGGGVFRAAGSAFDRCVPRRADAVVALSNRAATALRAAGCRRVSLVPPGLDPADFAGVSPRRAAGPTVAYAGNADAYQDLPVLYEAMRGLRDARLRLVGPGPWMGAPAAEIVPTSAWGTARDWIAGADVAVVPRSVCAGFPIKLLNALALGVPCVVAAGSAQGLPGEVVVADRDPQALAAGIRTALAMPRPDPAALHARTAWEVRAPVLVRIFTDAIGATR